MKPYTYIHKTSDTGKIFYIGKGLDKRYLQKSSRNIYWKNIVNKHGFTAEILAYWDTEKEAFEHEKILIASFNDMGFELCNLSIGGDGGSLGIKQSQETIEKRSIAMKNFLSTNEKRKNILLSLEKIRSNKEIQEKRKKNMALSWADSIKKEKRLAKVFSKENKQKHLLRMSDPDVKLRHKFGAKEANGVGIICIDTNKTFDSFLDALDWLKLLGNKNPCRSNLWRACVGKRKTAYGYQWRYKL